MSYKVIPFEQPAGMFLMTVMPANEIIRISNADPRRFDEASLDTKGGIQRQISRRRIKEIAAYANTVDAAFPTPILLALSENDYELDGNKLKVIGDNVADIVDGQHRIEGLKLADTQEELNIPVVFLLNPTSEQKALIFATINGKQTKVPASLIFDLFGITKTRSPQKTAHEIARGMNSTPKSPWFKRLKMLGIKTKGSIESLSQGTFVKFLLPHITKDADLDRSRQKDNKDPLQYDDRVFNDYYRKQDDSTILKILMNVFSAARSTWPNEWSDPSTYTLTKTNGFTGIMKALKPMVERGMEIQDLSKGYFESVFKKVKSEMDKGKIQFTVKHFEPSSVGENKLRDMIRNAVQEI